jgi:hypothetical protein
MNNAITDCTRSLVCNMECIPVLFVHAIQAAHVSEHITYINVFRTGTTVKGQTDNKNRNIYINNMIY